MQSFEIDAGLFYKLVESSGLKLSEKQIVIDLEKVEVVLVYRHVRAMNVDCSGEAPSLGLSETLRRYPSPALNMKVMEFFTRERMEPHGTRSTISRALRVVRNLCYPYGHEQTIATMREFISEVSLTELQRTPNCGVNTTRVIVDTLMRADLSLRDL